MDVNFYAPLRCKLVHYLYITDAMSQNFVTLEVVRELLQTQERSYQAAIKLLITDVRSEMKDIKKEIEEFKDSLEFTQREVNDNQDRVMDIETRLEGLKVRIDDQMDTIEKVEDDVEYIENQSRRNNIKILGVEENNTTEKSWDDTEKMVKNIIREKLDINEEINIERAHRVGKPRPPSSLPSRHDGSKVTPRPIIAKISSWKQKEQILRVAREKKPRGVMFYPDFAKRTLDRRAKRIPELMEHRKNGRIAYFVKDKVVVKTGRPPARLSKDSTSSSGEVTINIHGSSEPK